ncbi:hypothetical protein NX059_003996 [Plenodomus lindquistii]|nr:hypothetical protein NX059_003996 [Plenodomus lindquistii]
MPGRSHKTPTEFGNCQEAGRAAALTTTGVTPDEQQVEAQRGGNTFGGGGTHASDGATSPIQRCLNIIYNNLWFGT